MADPLTSTFVPIMKGLALTLKHYVRMLNPLTRPETQVTVEYPEVRREQ
jgi:hypothetical protein